MPSEVVSEMVVNGKALVEKRGPSGAICYYVDGKRVSRMVYSAIRHSR